MASNKQQQDVKQVAQSPHTELPTDCHSIIGLE